MADTVITPSSPAPIPEPIDSSPSGSGILNMVKSYSYGMLKGNTADTLGAPVDLVKLVTDATLSNPVGEFLGYDPTLKPRFGSEHMRQIMGLEVEDANLAETAGSLISVGGAAKAMIVGMGRAAKVSKNTAAAEKADYLLNYTNVNPASTFNLTGAYKEADGGIRTVISDAEAKLNNYNLSTGGTHQGLDEVLTHPELFKLYPELKEYTLKKSNELGPGVKGSFTGSTNGKFGTITIPEDAPVNTDLLSVILHETQHAIQNLEGWGRGGSPAKFLPENIGVVRDKIIGAIKTANTSADPAMVDAAQRYKDKFNNITKNAQTKYENIPGEQEARFTQDNMNKGLSSLASNVLMLLKGGTTPASADTKPLK